MALVSRRSRAVYLCRWVTMRAVAEALRKKPVKGGVPARFKRRRASRNFTGEGDRVSVWKSLGVVILCCWRRRTIGRRSAEYVAR